MGIKIVAKAPTVHQLDSLIKFGMEVEKHPDGSFEASEEFSSVEEAKDFLEERAKSYFEDHPCESEEEYNQAITVIKKYGILTLDAVTGYVITEDDEQQ